MMSTRYQSILQQNANPTFDVSIKSSPMISGCLIMVTGFVTVVLGAVEVSPVAAAVNATHVEVQHGLRQGNCFGLTLLSGILLLLTGILIIRAVFEKRIASVLKFFVMAMIAWLANTVSLLIQLCVAMLSLVPPPAPKDMPELDETYGFAVVHLLGVCFSVMGVMELTGVVARYYDDVLFGDIQLMKSWFGKCGQRCGCFKVRTDTRPIASRIQMIG